MKVLLLAGGDSPEREVSLSSGKAVFEALQRLGHEVTALDPATGNSLLDSSGKFLTADVEKTPEMSHTLPTLSPTLPDILNESRLCDIEVVFIALHGGAGENGVMQCLLDVARVPYTGSGMKASAVAMDKAMAKRLFLSVGIDTPEWELHRLNPQEVTETTAQALAGRFDFPLIVKPNDSGSTVGLTKVESPFDLKDALVTAAKVSREVLVEKYIPGREMTVAVLDGKALPVVEIKAASGLYDFEAKYTKGKSEYFVPADIPEKTARQLQEAAEKAYAVIGAAGLVRVDFILAENDAFYCLELNTVPGMTNLSLAPMAAKAAGIEFDELISHLLESALRK